MSPAPRILVVEDAAKTAATVRRYLEVDPARPRFVRTVFGAGYRLGDPSDAVSAGDPDDARGGTP